MIKQRARISVGRWCRCKAMIVVVDGNQAVLSIPDQYVYIQQLLCQSAFTKVREDALL